MRNVVVFHVIYWPGGAAAMRLQLDIKKETQAPYSTIFAKHNDNNTGHNIVCCKARVYEYDI